VLNHGVGRGGSFTEGGTLPLTGVGGPVTAPVYLGTDVVGVLGFTTALAIQLCKFKWVPSGENRVVAQICFRGGDA
jgi:hypothetical protein